MPKPSKYVLGSGHVTFFYDKLNYILKRYHTLAEEMRDRGYTVNQIPDEDLKSGIPEEWMGEYYPDHEAIGLNIVRLKARMPKGR